MERIYDLRPTNGRKSFGGKAAVLVEDDGTKTLYSYGTLVLRELPDGSMVRLWDGYSKTTGNHVLAFAGIHAPHMGTDACGCSL